MACKYNIKVVEHNDFTLLFPLKKRTYVASLPIDEDIVIMDLENVKVTIGGVEFASTLDERGVMVAVAYDALERGTYDIIITAEYHGAQIRAAYFEGLTIVNWNMQSDAEQYLPGSPIVMQAAFVIGGPLTDAELEALKEEFRERNAQLAQAIADAEAAKREWEEKAAELDGVAKEQTLTQGVQDIRDDISHIDIDTSTLAKETTAEAAKQAALDAKSAAQALAPVAAAAEAYAEGKPALATAITAKGVTTQATDSLAQMAQNVSQIVAPSPLDNLTQIGYTQEQINIIKNDIEQDVVKSLENFGTAGAIIPYTSNFVGLNSVVKAVYCDVLPTGSQANRNFYGTYIFCKNNVTPLTLYYSYQNVPNLKMITGEIDMSNVGAVNKEGFLSNAINLVYIRLKGIQWNFDLRNSLLLSYDSLLFMVQNIVNVSGYTLMIGSGNLAKLNATAEGQAAIATAQGYGWTIA